MTRQIRDRGPLTVAEYMELALYHDELGYYSQAARRTGRAGDFYTSVDVGPWFGQLLANQLSEMWHQLAAHHVPSEDGTPVTFVEAGAGDGRLARDVLDAAQQRHPDWYVAIHLQLVERSARARAAQPVMLGPHAPRLRGSSVDLPTGIHGVIFANELLDALPVHVVTMTEGGLREVFVDVGVDGLEERIGPLSRPELAAHLEAVGARLEPGWRAEVGLSAVDWVRRAASSLVRGYLLLIDYGHEATELYSAARATGTLATYQAHRLDQVGGPAGEAHSGRSRPAWLSAPGLCDMTAHVDLTSVRRGAEDAGLEMIAELDQTYFLLALGAADLLSAPGEDSLGDIRKRLALKTLVMPGGLGSSHKVLIFGKGVGRPSLRGCAFGARLT